MPVGLPEFYENPENRCPVLLLLDTSASMSGAPIAALNQGIAAFKGDVLQNTQASLSVEVAIVTFGPVELVQDFVTIDHFAPPTLKASGFTPLGEAIAFGLDLVEKRKEVYRENGIQYFRPWLFLITDGTPNFNSPWRRSAQRLQAAEGAGKVVFFSVGVQGANLDILKQLSSQRTPALLDELKFETLFLWLSQSMQQVSGSRVGEGMVPLPPIEGWGKVPT